MDVYIPLIVYLLIVSIFTRKRKLLSVILTLIPLVLFWGTKVDFGPDYSTYQFWYDRRHDMSFAGFVLDAMGGKFEPGFFLLLKLMPSFNGVVLVQATFLIVSAYIFFNEFLPKYSLPLALFLWLYNSAIFNTFSAMRSSFVIGFFLLAVVAKTRQKSWVAILLTFFGAQFHMSGYLMILFMLLPYNFFQKREEIITPLVFVFVLIALLLPSVFTSIMNTAVESNDNLSTYDYAKEANYGLGFYAFSFVRLGFIVYILDLQKRKRVEEKYIWIAWLTIAFYLFTMVQIDIMYRVFNYLFLITVAFKCYVLKIDKSAMSRIYVGLSVAYALYNFYEYMHGRLMPFYEHYQSFLFQ